MKLRRVDALELGTTWPRGHYGESRTVVWQGHAYILGAGSSDRLSFWRDLYDNALFVVTTNRALGYIGVERLDPEDCTPHPDARNYLHDEFKFFDQNATDELLELADHNVIRRHYVGAHA